MSDLRDPSGYNLVLAATAPVVIAPAISKITTTANLAAGASVDLELSIDQVPFLDMILSADQDLTVQTFVRLDSSDTFRQIDNDIPYTAGIKYDRMLGSNTGGTRMAGSLLRIRITNPGLVDTTRLSAEIQARST